MNVAARETQFIRNTVGQLCDDSPRRLLTGPPYNVEMCGRFSLSTKLDIILQQFMIPL